MINDNGWVSLQVGILQCRNHKFNAINTVTWNFAFPAQPTACRKQFAVAAVDRGNRYFSSRLSALVDHRPSRPPPQSFLWWERDTFFRTRNFSVLVFFFLYFIESDLTLFRAFCWQKCKQQTYSLTSNNRITQNIPWYNNI